MLSATSRAGIPSLTPLADVVFLLVIFFMLATNFTNREVAEISLAAPSETGGGAGEEATLTLIDGRRFLLNGEEVGGGSLLAALSSRPERDKRAGLLIRVRGGAAQDLTDALLFSQRAGFARIRLERTP